MEVNVKKTTFSFLFPHNSNTLLYILDLKHLFMNQCFLIKKII